jgi:uncharacterized protein (UPF0248 family)
MNTSSESQGMYLIYIDESYDETHFAYSALFVDAFNWNEHLKKLREWRNNLFQNHGIPLDYELHATNFVGGRGQAPVNRDKSYRAQLFFETIGMIEKMKTIDIINAITPNKKNHLLLFDYMLNRINRALEDKNAIGILICDEGNENKLTSIVRKMKKSNHVPSKYSHTGGRRDIPLHRIIEDPLFKTSKSSYFIQLADFVAFSLLRSEKPLPTTLGPVATAFNQLDQTLIKKAFRNDPKQEGIIRA